MNKILVIDDDKAINELIKINLELQGYKVVQAYNGTEGFALAKQEIPELIVLDVMMPEVDGFTVAQRIRQAEEISDTPIIMLTALSELNNKVNGFNIGVDDYLTKPFEIEELIVRVRALLKRTKKIPKTSAVRDLLSYKEITLIPESYSVQIKDKAFKKIFFSTIESSKIVGDKALVEIISFIFDSFVVLIKKFFTRGRFSSKISSKECNIITIGLLIVEICCKNFTLSVVIFAFNVVVLEEKIRSKSSRKFNIISSHTVASLQ